MIKKFFLTLIAGSSFFVACKSDDSKGVDKETTIPIEERNSLDDKAINQFLEDHYFHPGDTINGKVVRSGVLSKFDTIKGNEDDKYPSLKSIAKQDPTGFLYAESPYQKGSETASTITSNDDNKIYISYNAQYFRATNNMNVEKNPSQKYYGTLALYAAPTYNVGDGSPVTDPSFYYFIPTQTEAKKGIKRENLELKYFIEGLKHFKPTNRSLQDNYSFQGVIILPSRLAFARNKYYQNNSLTENSAFRDASFIFNFELVKTETRSK